MGIKAITPRDFITEDFILLAKAMEKSESLKPFKEAKEAFEVENLRNLLQLFKGNATRAAKMAGKYRADFCNLMNKHNMQTAGFKKPD